MLEHSQAARDRGTVDEDQADLWWKQPVNRPCRRGPTSAAGDKVLRRLDPSKHVVVLKEGAA